jgi:hypothetical protein
MGKNSYNNDIDYNKIIEEAIEASYKIFKKNIGENKQAMNLRAAKAVAPQEDEDYIESKLSLFSEDKRFSKYNNILIRELVVILRTFPADFIVQNRDILINFMAKSFINKFDDKIGLPFLKKNKNDSDIRQSNPNEIINKSIAQDLAGELEHFVNKILIIQDLEKDYAEVIAHQHEKYNSILHQVTNNYLKNPTVKNLNIVDTILCAINSLDTNNNNSDIYINQKNEDGLSAFYIARRSLDANLTKLFNTHNKKRTDTGLKPMEARAFDQTHFFHFHQLIDKKKSIISLLEAYSPLYQADKSDLETLLSAKVGNIIALERAINNNDYGNAETIAGKMNELAMRMPQPIIDTFHILVKSKKNSSILEKYINVFNNSEIENENNLFKELFVPSGKKRRTPLKTAIDHKNIEGIRLVIQGMAKAGILTSNIYGKTALELINESDLNNEVKKKLNMEIANWATDPRAIMNDDDIKDILQNVQLTPYEKAASIRRHYNDYSRTSNVDPCSMRRVQLLGTFVNNLSTTRGKSISTSSTEYTSLISPQTKGLSYTEQLDSENRGQQEIFL